MPQKAKLTTYSYLGDNASFVPITQNDFVFINYPNIQRAFKTTRPYNLVTSSPSLETYTNAIYQPLSQTLFNGCLYNEQKERIEESCVKRGLTDNCLTKDHLRFAGDTHDLPTYEQPLLYLGHLLPHYGHFLLESLSRWWPMRASLGDVDHYLIHLRDAKSLDLPYVKTCLAALKIDRDKILYFDQPTKLKQVVVPQASFQIYSHVFTQYKELAGRVASELCHTELKPTEQPLYVSRRLLSSGLSNYRGEEHIEEFLLKRGTKVIHPQKLSLAEQVQLYNEHKTIIGLNGSGLLNIAFSLSAKNVITLTHHFLAPNYFLINKCFNANATYIQACTKTDRLRWLLDIVLGQTVKRTNLNSQRKLNRIYNLDYKRTINWLSKSGYC